MSRRNETLSRKGNGAVHVGNTDLILPVRVRTCAENVGRTEGLSGFLGMQPVRASNGRIGEASQRYFAGQLVGRSACEPPPCGRSMGSSPPAWSSERENADILSGYFGAWRCHVETMAIHSDRMKSPAVPARTTGGASAIYKAKPKGCATRRICEAVSGSTDSGDGSRAVVASLPLREVKRETVLSEHAMRSVDKGKLAVLVKATKWPARPLSGNPAPSLSNVPQYPPGAVCGCIVTGDSHV